MFRTLGCALIGTLLATPVLAGPSWISIEYPANPHHPSTRGAAMLVHAYHHSSAMDVPVRGTMEGIVDGRRTSLPLDIRKTNIPGVFAVRSALPRNGTWVLAIQLHQDGHGASAGALVTLDERGRIANVEVPSSQNREGWVVPRALEARDIDAALRNARVAAADARWPAGLAGVGVPLLLIGLGTLRRRR